MSLTGLSCLGVVVIEFPMKSARKNRTSSIHESTVKVETAEKTSTIKSWREKGYSWIDTVVPKRNQRSERKALERICSIWASHIGPQKKYFFRNDGRDRFSSSQYWRGLGATSDEARAMSQINGSPKDFKWFVLAVTSQLVKSNLNVPLVFEGAQEDFREESYGHIFWRKAINRNRGEPSPGEIKDQCAIVIGTDYLEVRNGGYLRDLELCRSPADLVLRSILREFVMKFSWGWIDKFRIESEAVGRAFDVIMSNTCLRERLLDDNNRQVSISLDVAEWELSLNAIGSLSPQLKTQSGYTLTGQIIRLGSSLVYYLHEAVLYRCDNDWIEKPGFVTDQIPQIDHTLLKSKPLLEFVRKNNIKFQNQHLDEVEFKAAQARFTCWLEKVTNDLKNEDHEIFCLRAYALDGEGVEVCVRTGKGWENVARSEDSKTAIYSSSSLTQLDQQLQALPGNLQFDKNRQLFWTGIDENFEEMFTAWYEKKPEGIEIEVKGELASLADGSNKVQLNFDFRSTGIDWFDVALCADKSELAFSPTEILSLLSASRQTTLRKRVNGKGWVELDAVEVQAVQKQAVELGVTLPEVLNSQGKVHALNVARNTNSTISGLGSDTIKKAQKRVKAILKGKKTSNPKGFRAELRTYQQEGFNFLSFLSESNLGGILADDMGLGKTVQTIAWLSSLRNKAKYRSSFKALIVCPKSVIDVWLHEIGKFAPSLARLIVTDIAAVKDTEGNFIGIFGYTRARLNTEVLTAVRWNAVVLDEAQAIKNPDSLVAQAVFNLKCDHRLALTGTPVENRLLDLWSIMNFAQPGMLGPIENFKKTGITDEIEAATYLRAKVRPFMLRRTKAQVLPDLPSCIQEDILCEMSQKQALLYRAELKKAQRLLVLLKKGGREGAKAKFLMLTILTRLRQIACHPGLVDESLRKKPSSKVAAALDILTPVIESGNSVVIFSQFLGMLRFVETEIRKLGIKSYTLTGATENRGNLVSRFTVDNSPSVFLISLKAGGSGLNLTKASHVVLLDPWWNPAVEQQAIDRLHRIGQKQSVNAYRILAKNTVEERVRQLQKLKSELFKAVVDEGTFSAALTTSDFEVLLGVRS